MVERQHIFLNSYGSVVRYIQECREWLMENNICKNIEFRDLDGHAEDRIIENEDYLFIKDFSGNIDYQFRDWFFNIGVSTFEDDNLFRHHQIVDFLLDQFQPTMTIPLIDHSNITKTRGSLIIKDPTTLQPFSKYNTRAVQYLLVNVSSTETMHEHQPLDHILDRA